MLYKFLILYIVYLHNLLLTLCSPKFTIYSEQVFERRKVVSSVSDELFKPGTDNVRAGEYKEVGSRGGSVKNPRQVTIDKGDRLPPTQEKGHKWKKI